jgi:hypothetical protein
MGGRGGSSGGGGGGGTANTAGGISYVKSATAKRSGDVAVKVSISKLNKEWKKNPINYIPRGGKSNTTEKKYDNAKTFLKNNKTGVKMPEVSLGKNGTLTVRDGRHRTAALRDTRKKTMFVTVKKSQAKQLKEKFGAD